MVNVGTARKGSRRRCATWEIAHMKGKGNPLSRMNENGALNTKTTMVKSTKNWETLVWKEEEEEEGRRSCATGG